MMVLVFNEYWFYVGNEAAGIVKRIADNTAAFRY